MLNIKLLTVAFALTSTACAQDVQKEFTGIGNIFVLNSSDWRVADPVADKVGCLDNKGSFISPKSDADCAVFSRLAAYPYTLSTQDGNCTFQDETQERNTDSIYGKQDHSWNCLTPFQSQIYDELYTVVRLLFHSYLPHSANNPTDRLLIPLPLLWRRLMLLRHQEDPTRGRKVRRVAVPLGLAAAGHHAGPRHVAIVMEPARRFAQARERGKAGSWAEGVVGGRLANPAAGPDD